MRAEVRSELLTFDWNGRVARPRLSSRSSVDQWKCRRLRKESRLQPIRHLFLCARFSRALGYNMNEFKIPVWMNGGLGPHDRPWKAFAATSRAFRRSLLNETEWKSSEWRSLTKTTLFICNISHRFALFYCGQFETSKSLCTYVIPPSLPLFEITSRNLWVIQWKGEGV